MGTSSRNKGSYHERWWCNWFTEKGCEARRQPLSGALGGDFKSDISINAEQGRLVAESKYQATGRGFSFLTKTHQKQPADIYLLKQKTGPNFICIEASHPLAEKFVRWLGGG
jgi:hypothetical protein